MSLKANPSPAWARLLLTLAINLIALVAITLLSAVIAYCTEDPLALVKPLSLAAVILSAAASGFLASRLFGMGESVLGALIITLILFTVGLIAKRGAVEAGAVINYLSYIGTSVLFAYFATKRGRVKRRRRRI